MESLLPAGLSPVSPGLQAHASGALWIPDSQTVIVADLHLGYSWAQRRRGELGPLVDSRTREKLLRMRDDLQPKRFVFLGDIVHAPRPCMPERQWIEDTLTQLAQTAELISVRGNHDRRFSAEFGNLISQEVAIWSEALVTAAHGDRLPLAWPENHILLLGHLHPCLAIRDSSGAGHKLPVFLVNANCVILPAFSPFARGYDVTSGLPEDIGSCFRGEPIEVYATTGRRVVPLGPLRGALDTMVTSDASSAFQFRKGYRKKN